MQINIFDNNLVRLVGRITRIKPYAKAAANVVLAIDNGIDKDGNPKSQYISLKSFKPDEWNNWTVGALVEAYGHMSSNKYEKDDEIVYSQDIVLDHIIYRESKSVIESREAIKADQNQ